MVACGQDTGWHSEGDVWTHTKMVCVRLHELEGWSSLTTHERTVLTFTALFCDSGKPITSVVDPISGRVASPKHAVRGEHFCRAVLRDLECDLATREEIARLVRFRGRPPFLLEKPDPAHEVVSLSLLVSNKLLYLISLPSIWPAWRRSRPPVTPTSGGSGRRSRLAGKMARSALTSRPPSS
jgi:hypothetical protein